MKSSIRRKLQKHQRRVEAHKRRRSEHRALKSRAYGEPVISTQSRTYDMSERSRGLCCGGVPLMLKIAHHIGLVDAIDSNVHLLRWWLPYRESDHVLNFAINAWCNGQRLRDMDINYKKEWGYHPLVVTLANTKEVLSIVNRPGNRP